jgi:hypothetical protein
MVAGALPQDHRKAVLTGTEDVQLGGRLGRAQGIEEFDLRGPSERVIFRNRKKCGGGYWPEWRASVR